MGRSWSAAPSTYDDGRRSPSVEQRVRALRQEIGELVVEHEPIEKPDGIAQPAVRWSTQPRQFLVADRPIEIGGRLPAVIEASSRCPPLPELGARDLGRRR